MSLKVQAASSQELVEDLMLKKISLCQCSFFNLLWNVRLLWKSHYLNSKVYICSYTQWIVRGQCLRDLVSNLVPNTPSAPSPGVGDLVTSCLPNMVNVAIVSINENTQDPIEYAVTHGVHHRSPLCLWSTVPCFIPRNPFCRTCKQ